MNLNVLKITDEIKNLTRNFPATIFHQQFSVPAKYSVLDISVLLEKRHKHGGNIHPFFFFFSFYDGPLKHLFVEKNLTGI